MDTGLVRFGARDYDGRVGRWTATDPTQYTGGLNLYSYANADPVNLLDVTGLVPGVHVPSSSLFFYFFQYLRDMHMNRNRYNVCPPRSPASSSGNVCDGRKWTPDWSGNKWRAPDDSECAYDTNGDLLADQDANYTYNYGPDPFTFDHVIKDFLSHFMLSRYYTPGQATRTGSDQ